MNANSWKQLSMIIESPLGQLNIVGDRSTAGTYLLRIRVSNPLEIVFGRFKRGKTICLSKADYVYVGSALSEKGATCLARRLVRHASRLGKKIASCNPRPDAIRVSSPGAL